MTQPRNRLVSLDDTPYYHCISRCVRRAFLCGIDATTGFDFSHRRGWLEGRLHELANVFAIDLCAYAVMSNHYHVVLRIDIESAQCWSHREVAERWCRLFSGPLLVRRWLAGDPLDDASRTKVHEFTDLWRERLHSLSWFMRCVNEPLARIANREDGCTGRFWEGRFKSQALLDEKALLTCMAYVDLNPVRAAVAKTPESAPYTSVHHRIQNPGSGSLRRFAASANDDNALPFRFEDYLNLVDWAGRSIRSDKRGHVPQDAPAVLTRLGIQPGELAEFLSKKQVLPRAMGPLDRMQTLAKRIGARFLKGAGISRRLFARPA